MAKAMKVLTAVLLIATCVSGCLYRIFPYSTLLTIAITCGTTGYHFAVRLLIGALFQWADPQHDPYKKWYRPRPWEKKLYQRLNVKAWKNVLPTYAPDSFSPQLHTWDEITRAMCRAELVHEVIILFSFLPLLGALWFRALPVFLITSVLAAGFDLLFVIVQRYNRPRAIRLAGRQKELQK